MCHVPTQLRLNPLSLLAVIYARRDSISMGKYQRNRGCERVANRGGGYTYREKLSTPLAYADRPKPHSNQTLLIGFSCLVNTRVKTLRVLQRNCSVHLDSMHFSQQGLRHAQQNITSAKTFVVNLATGNCELWLMNLAGGQPKS